MQTHWPACKLGSLPDMHFNLSPAAAMYSAWACCIISSQDMYALGCKQTLQVAINTGHSKCAALWHHSAAATRPRKGACIDFICILYKGIDHV
jgi:hypothetical protein